jgi:hypothetical protein
MKGIRFVLLVFLSSALAGACAIVQPEVTGTPQVVQMMPDLAGYKVVEGQTIQGYVATLAEGGTLLSGHPELAALIETLDGVSACYREAGAVNTRVYSNVAFPLSSGAVAIADRNLMTSPRTLFRCVGGGEQIMSLAGGPTLEPCSNSYTLAKDDNEFYIIYVGTTNEICQAFCASLEGCSK